MSQNFTQLQYFIYSHFEVIDTVVMWLDKKVIKPHVELPEIAQDVAKIREPTLDLIHFLDFFYFFYFGRVGGGLLNTDFSLPIEWQERPLRLEFLLPCRCLGLVKIQK